MWNTRGQALLELAVFGMIAMAALGFLIRVGMQMNFDQEVRMAAFRRALAAASADDARANPTHESAQDAVAVSYYYANDRQMPNPTDGYMSLSRSRSEASAFVEWGDRLTFAYEDPHSPNAGHQTHQHIIVRSNNKEQDFRQEDFPKSSGDNFAFQGVVSHSELTNTSRATISQNAGGSSVASNSSTGSTIYVNTKGGETPVRSSVSGSANWSP